LRDVFLQHHAELFTAAWWRLQAAQAEDVHLFTLPTSCAAPAA
jgi:isocitrate dehydrogenase kinase/phosphatase